MCIRDRTHFTGGSAGREGAAIQLGGSIANQLGRWIHLDEEDRHVIVMCGTVSYTHLDVYKRQCAA